MDYDIAIIGSGPGGYVAAIRASQLGKSVAIIEKENLGGICLNWGCIPTKALLRSTHILHDIKNAASFGIDIQGEIVPDFGKIINRSRDVAATMSKGIQFLLSKNNVTIINGTGYINPDKSITINSNSESQDITAKSIIIATGARAKHLPNIPIDGKNVITYREAMSLEKLPESMIVVGSGAIGVELASFYHDLGTKVTIIEYMPNIVPLEDEEISKYLERSFRKNRLPFMTSTSVDNVSVTDNMCEVKITTTKGEQTLSAEIVLSAVGVTPNTENLGLEDLGVSMEKGKILTDNHYKTNIDGIYAIGDVIPTPALAHVASAEAINCVESICGVNPKEIDYKNIPSCVYTTPEIASIGLKEKEAIDAGYDIKIGKFPFTASGKATAAGNRDGFIKLIFNNQDETLLGAHLIGSSVTEMLMEAGIAKSVGAKIKDILHTIHPHPTMSEGIMEAAADALNEAIHT